MRQAMASSRKLMRGPAAAAARYNRPNGKEIKTLDVQLAGAFNVGPFNPITDTLNSNDSALVLNCLQQGTADFNRIGKSVNMKSLRIRGHVTRVYTTPTIGASAFNELPVRIVIVHIKSEEQAIPDFNQLFGGIQQGGQSLVSLDSGVLPYRMQDVTVLRDIMLKATADNPGDAATGGDVLGNRLLFDEFIPLKGLQTVYKGTANPVTIANIMTGAIVMYIRGAYYTLDDHAMIDEDGVARLRYEDN